MVKILLSYLYIFSYILSYLLIDNTVFTGIAPISNLIFPNSLLVKTVSSAQSYSYFRNT